MKYFVISLLIILTSCSDGTFLTDKIRYKMPENKYLEKRQISGNEPYLQYIYNMQQRQMAPPPSYQQPMMQGQQYGGVPQYQQPTGPQMPQQYQMPAQPSMMQQGQYGGVPQYQQTPGQQMQVPGQMPSPMMGGDFPQTYLDEAGL